MTTLQDLMTQWETRPQFGRTTKKPIRLTSFLKKSFAIGLQQTMKERFVGSPCPYCGVILTDIHNDDAQWTRDHVMPRISGRPEVPIEENIAHVCAKCNRLKSDFTIFEFLYWYPEVMEMRDATVQ